MVMWDGALYCNPCLCTLFITATPAYVCLLINVKSCCEGCGLSVSGWDWNKSIYYFGGITNKIIKGLPQYEVM